MRFSRISTKKDNLRVKNTTNRWDMKLKIVAALILLGLTACGQKDYYAAVTERDTRQIEAEKQKRDAFAEAMVRAAETESATDDIAIAMAYGMPASPFMVIAPPDTAVDYLRALVPWLSLGLEGYRTYVDSQKTEVPTFWVGGDFDLSGQNSTSGDGNSFTQERTYYQTSEESDDSTE